jgi:hypothetical protein
MCRCYINTITVFLDISLSPILFLFETHNVSEIGFCLRLQVEPTQLGPIDRASLYLGRCVLNKNRTMQDVKKHNNCTEIIV